MLPVYMVLNESCNLKTPDFFPSQQIILTAQKLFISLLAKLKIRWFATKKMYTKEKDFNIENWLIEESMEKNTRKI